MADLGVDEVANLKVNDLKKELKSRGLSVAGTKSELTTRLLEAIGKGAGPEAGSEEGACPEDELLNDPAEDVQPKGSTVPAKDPDTDAAKVPAADSTAHTATATLPSAGGAVKAVADLKKMTVEERLKLRQQKFNVVSADVKKEARAKRFGIPDTGAAASTAAAPVAAAAAKAPGSAESGLAASLEKLKQRRERFGQAVSETIKKVEETEKILKRKQRFGAVAAVAVTADVEEKKRKRAERFGQTTA